MRSLHIIMPMAGEGNRFLKEGWSTPKPLIELNGKPLFLHAIGSLNLEKLPVKYSFIVRKEHIDNNAIDKRIKEILPEASIFCVEKTTRGAVETCLLAECAIDKDDCIIIMDCDLEFRSKAFTEYITQTVNSKEEELNGGALVSFLSNDSRYSYAEIDENNQVKRTAEKEVISNHALCGAYFFSSAKGFLNAAHMLLNESVFTKPEYYVSLLFNYLLKNGGKVMLASMEEYHSYGTPEELKRYL